MPSSTLSPCHQVPCLHKRTVAIPQTQGYCQTRGYYPDSQHLWPLRSLGVALEAGQRPREKCAHMAGKRPGCLGWKHLSPLSSVLTDWADPPEQGLPLRSVPEERFNLQGVVARLWKQEWHLRRRCFEAEGIHVGDLGLRYLPQIPHQQSPERHLSMGATRNLLGHLCGDWCKEKVGLGDRRTVYGASAWSFISPSS